MAISGKSEAGQRVAPDGRLHASDGFVVLSFLKRGAGWSWAQAIDRDGFAVVPDVVAPEVVAGVDRLARCQGTEPGDPRAGGRTYAMRDLLREVPETRRLADSAPLRTLVQDVLGPGSFVVRGLLFDKTPEANWPVPWHQDLTIAVKARSDAPGYGPWTVKGGVPHVRPPIAVLERCSRSGSTSTTATRRRAAPRRAGLAHARAARRRGNRAAGSTRVAPVTCLVPRGGVLLMRPLILHASSPAADPRHRRVVHLEYAAGRLPGNVEWFEIPTIRSQPDRE